MRPWGEYLVMAATSIFVLIRAIDGPAEPMLTDDG